MIPDRPTDIVALEVYVRRLRNNVYGPNPKHCTDEGWESVKRNWMRPDSILWLETQPENKQFLTAQK